MRKSALRSSSDIGGKRTTMLTYRGRPYAKLFKHTILGKISRWRYLLHLTLTDPIYTEVCDLVEPSAENLAHFAHFKLDVIFVFFSSVFLKIFAIEND